MPKAFDGSLVVVAQEKNRLHLSLLPFQCIEAARDLLFDNILKMSCLESAKVCPCWHMDKCEEYHGKLWTFGFGNFNVLDQAKEADHESPEL